MAAAPRTEGPGPFALAALLVVALLASPGSVRAATIGVGFAGSITSASGSVPSGPLPIGEPFTGTLIYEADQPNLMNSLFGGEFVFDTSPSGLRITVGGLTYASGLPFRIEIRLAIVDPDDPDLEDPTNPDAILRETFDAFGQGDGPVGGADYELRLVATILGSTNFPVELPQSAGALAGSILGAEISITGTGGADFALSGTIEATLPEPTTALLVLVGLLGLSVRARGRGRRRR